MAKTIWGVDSASAVDQELYSCVVKEFGTPGYWGRYLKTVPRAADGLTPAEIRFLHQKGVKIMPIYSDFKEAVGYRNGQITARNAIYHAQRLGAPKNIVIFANIEHFFNVDEGWIRGWVDTFYPSGYRPGFYHDPAKGKFSAAFCQAVANNNKVAQQAVLWSAEPEPGATKEKDAPEFKPETPHCSANVWAWQYGRDAGDCPIDTNLIIQKLYKNLW